MMLLSLASAQPWHAGVGPAVQPSIRAGYETQTRSRTQDGLLPPSAKTQALTADVDGLLAGVAWTAQVMASRSLMDFAFVSGSADKGFIQEGGLHLGMGGVWGTDRIEVQTTIGPRIASSAFSRGFYDRAREEGLWTDPASLVLGLRARIRARLALGSNWALEGRTHTDVQRSTRLAEHVAPARRALGPQALSSISSFGVMPTLEVQRRMVKGLWMTANLMVASRISFRHDPTTTGRRSSSTEHLISGHAGVRWR